MPDRIVFDGSLSRRDLKLLRNRPGAGGAGLAMPADQVPGGWNRIQIEIENLEAAGARLKLQQRGSAMKS